MAVVNGPQFPLVTLGKPVKIGSIATSTDVLQFSLPATTDQHLGHVIIQAVPNGTVTTFTAAINVSLDGGTTFNPQKPAGGTTLASDTSSLNFQSTPLQSVAMPGIGGGHSLQFAAATLTLGTATKIDIWAHCAG